jgi:hypothetical protein
MTPINFVRKVWDELHCMKVLATAMARQGEPLPPDQWGDVIGSIPIDHTYVHGHHAARIPLPAPPPAIPTVPQPELEHWLPSQLRTLHVKREFGEPLPIPVPRIWATNRAVLAWLRKQQKEGLIYTSG